MIKKKIKVIGGVKYYSDRPDRCRDCKFWKNRATGCTLGKCVLQLRGVRPFLSDKYDLTQHPNYRYTADFDKKYLFDIEEFLSTRAKLHPKDEFFVVEAEE